MYVSHGLNKDTSEYAFQRSPLAMSAICALWGVGLTALFNYFVPWHGFAWGLLAGTLACFIVLIIRMVAVFLNIGDRTAFLIGLFLESLLAITAIWFLFYIGAGVVMLVFFQRSSVQAATIGAWIALAAIPTMMSIFKEDIKQGLSSPDCLEQSQSSVVVFQRR